MLNKSARKHYARSSFAESIITKVVITVQVKVMTCGVKT